MLEPSEYPDDATLYYEYNKGGAIEEVYLIDQNQQKTDIVLNVDYAATGQILKIEYANGTTTAYTYNPFNLRLTHLATIDPQYELLQDLTYTFDNVGNIKRIDDAVSGHTPYQLFEYDDINRLTKATAPSYGTINYDYDSIGNMIQNGDKLLTYGENGAGPHAATSLISSQGTKSISYDANGNMVTKGSASLTYNTANNLTSVLGTTGPIPIVYTLHKDWNMLSFPIDFNDPLVSSVLSEIDGEYDQVSYLDTQVESFKDDVCDSTYNDFDSFQYGRGYELYVNNPLGAQFVAIGSVPDPIQVQLKTGWNLIANPNLVDLPVEDALSLSGLLYGTNPLTDDYDDVVWVDSQGGYHHYNQGGFTQMFPTESYYLHCLKDVTWQFGGSAGGSRSSSAKSKTIFEYDGDGGRIKKTEFYSDTLVNESMYVGSLYDITTDHLKNKTNYTKHIFLGGFQRIASIRIRDSNTEIFYNHSDHLGSSSVVSDKFGSQVEYNEYKPYGEFSKKDTLDYTDSLKHYFGGKEFDNTGLYYYGARYYDPEIGRFISPDTMVQSPEDPQTLNRYAYCDSVGKPSSVDYNPYHYCRNNPVNFVDPYGEFAIADDAVFILLAAVIAGAIIATQKSYPPLRRSNWTPSLKDYGINYDMDPFNPSKGPNFKPPWWAIPPMLAYLAKQFADLLKPMETENKLCDTKK